MTIFRDFPFSPIYEYKSYSSIIRHKPFPTSIHFSKTLFSNEGALTLKVVANTQIKSSSLGDMLCPFFFDYLCVFLYNHYSVEENEFPR